MWNTKSWDQVSGNSDRKEEETLEELEGILWFDGGCGVSGALKKLFEPKTCPAKNLVGDICHFSAAQHAFFLSRGTQISFWGSSSLPLHVGSKSRLPCPPTLKFPASRHLTPGILTLSRWVGGSDVADCVKSTSLEQPPGFLPGSCALQAWFSRLCPFGEHPSIPVI